MYEFYKNEKSYRNNAKFCCLCIIRVFLKGEPRSLMERMQERGFGQDVPVFQELGNVLRHKRRQLLPVRQQKQRNNFGFVITQFHGLIDDVEVTRLLERAAAILFRNERAPLRELSAAEALRRAISQAAGKRLVYSRTESAACR